MLFLIQSKGIIEDKEQWVFRHSAIVFQLNSGKLGIKCIHNDSKPSSI